MREASGNGGLSARGRHGGCKCGSACIAAGITIGACAWGERQVCAVGNACDQEARAVEVEQAWARF